uniref:Uncharacterized protein n=1 Tax=Peromyscus maniculatus bairdii TaxID=230844 RepID=A0A8C8UKK1_PERMB
MCTCSALFWLKAFSHSVQWNGPRRFSLPVWMRLCRSSWLGFAKAFSQVSHLNTLEGGGSPQLGRPLSPGCTLRCVARLKAFLQTRQPWMRSFPCTSLLWCMSTAAEEKARSQSRHWCEGPSFSGWLLGVSWAETSVTWRESRVPHYWESVLRMPDRRDNGYAACKAGKHGCLGITGVLEDTG